MKQIILLTPVLVFFVSYKVPKYSVFPDIYTVSRCAKCKDQRISKGYKQDTQQKLSSAFTSLPERQYFTLDYPVLKIF